MRALVAAGLLVGCALGPTRGFPLYSGARRAPDAVATLRGPVLLVDGFAPSSHDRSFELLPGCHVVSAGGSVGYGTDHDSWIAHLPTVVFAFRMRAAASYNISYRIDPTLGRGPIGTGQVVAHERDAQGRVRVVPALKSAAELDECRRWSPPS